MRTNRPVADSVVGTLLGAGLCLATVAGYYLALIVYLGTALGGVEHPRLWLLWLPVAVSPVLLVIALRRAVRHRPDRALWMAGTLVLIIADALIPYNFTA